ncbi:hypothetical protein MRB53_041708 [Persea americana]|nr:hypothetical protein MRB53_041708 [Persea americana]
MQVELRARPIPASKPAAVCVSRRLSYLAPRNVMTNNLSSSAGRRTSISPIDSSKPPQIDFHFLNFTHPSEAKTGKTRKAVRSHVTKQQHQRESAAAAAVKKARSGQLSPEIDDLDRLNIQQRSQITSDSPSRQSSLKLQLPSSSQSESPEASPLSISPTASPLQTPHARVDPLEIYPEEWHPYIPRIMDHYATHLAIDIPDVDGSETAGLLRTQILPFIFTDAAPLHATMLCAASHYGKARGSRSHSIDILRLRGMAIREINNALEDTNRALSDQLILAVAKWRPSKRCSERSPHSTRI